MPSASGWFVWTVPFWCLSSDERENIGRYCSYFFCPFVFSALLKEKIYLINGQSLSLTNVFTNFYDIVNVDSTINTTIFAIGILLIVRMY